MEERVMIGKTLWNVNVRKTAYERKPAGRRQAAQSVLMIASAIMGAFLLIGTTVSTLCAQSYPNKPIRFIVPMPPGGLHGILARIIGQKLSERLGQPVVVEHRGGAGGNVGTEAAAKARPDGYTIVIVSQGLSISPSMYKKLNYDPIKDLMPISLVAQVPMVVVVRPPVPVKNIKDLVEYAKENPEKLNYGSAGMGSPNHLAPELLNSLANIKMMHVPYKGSGPALTGLLGGEVDMMMTPLSAMLPYIKTGKLRALAVLSPERVPSLPDVPTAKEAGIDNFVMTSWYGILASGGTPRDIINRLNAEWIKVAAMPDTIEMINKAGAEPRSSAPEQFGKFLESEIVRWTKIIKEANIQSLD